MIHETDHTEPPRRTGPLAWVLILFVRLYQVTLRPVMGGQCRFQPTCSDYAIEALRTHGGIVGSWLTVRRILRCQPWGGCGYDPVPPRRSRRRHAAPDSDPHASQG
jgi:putative membrane protein insertion efficiency factor